MEVSQSLVRNAIGEVAVKPPRSTLRDLVPGILALLAAFPLAFLISLINRMLPGQPEKSVELIGVMLGLVIVLPPAAYVGVRRRATSLPRLALIALASIAVALVAIYLYWVSFYVAFPADILIWSESDFVNDILKFRMGYPLFTPQVNNESFNYMPGPQLLTYFLASLSGNPLSIPVYRMIQVGYTLLASFLAVLCARKLLELSLPSRQFDWKWWGIVWLPVAFLIASNGLTDPFVHALHDDALAQLTSIAAYLLLLHYVSSHDRRLWWAMAVLPAVAFFVKQSLIIWAPLYLGYLVLFDRPFALKRLTVFAAVSLGLVGAAAALCVAIWGSPFIYWIFSVLGSHGVSPLRSFQHVLDVWIYYAIGLVGGLVLMRGKRTSVLLGPWLVWLGLISTETYTSGIAYMINHIGPGCLVGGTWFMAALARSWNIVFRPATGRLWAQAWLRAGIALVLLVLVLTGMDLVRIPLPPLPQDAYRYMNDIEQQFNGQSDQTILLDAGTWVYLKEGIVMKDRAANIGERGFSQTGDFTGMIQRLNQKAYSKILVRDLNLPDFWYDYGNWAKSSGIKQALLDNYQVVGTIPAMKSNGWEPDLGYLFGEVSILVPKPN